MSVPPKIAINPLPWVFKGMSFDVSEATLRPALSDLRAVGFSALHSDVPPSMTVEQYLAMLDEYGFSPAPGYFAAEFHRKDKLTTILEDIKQHAAMIAALGVDATFVAGAPEIPRLMNPGWGENSSVEKIERSAEALALSAEAALTEGVRLALHPHLGMSIETEEETRGILDATAGSALGFGPDTGHLFSAGILPQQIIADYADRVVAVHLKDVDLNTLRTATYLSDDFMTATNVRHLWREPGRGAVNFPAVLDALGAFDGWFVVEVDVPSLPDRVDSARASLDYLQTLPYFQAVNA
jgi:inosose dehydratase